MILIPSGKYHVGTTDEQRIKLAQKYDCHPTWFNDDLPSQDIELRAFWLDRYPVTNAQYLAFVESTGHQKPTWWDENLTQEYADHPVVGVSGRDAKAYARWIGKRLPTAEEWEAAIRHPHGKVFPYGDNWGNDVMLPENTRILWTSPETKPIGGGKNGRSVSGIEDFAGQVSEWTSSVMPHHGVQFRMLRGASWFHIDPISYRSAFGYYAYEGWSSAFTGFRCASDAQLPNPDVSQIIKNIHGKRDIRQADMDGTIKIQSALGQSSYVSILIPFLGSEYIGLSAPEGVSWEGKSLLNWYDRRNLEWKTSADKYASYVMQFPDMELHAEFKAGQDFVDQVFTVINNTGKPGWFRSSSCFNPQSHPLFYDCEALRTYALTKNNGFELIRNFERPGECVHWITGSVGMELEGLKRAMLAVISQDAKWAIGCARADNDGRFSVACNMCFTCLHPDSSYYVNQKRSSKLRMYFIRGGLDDLLSRFDDDISQGEFDYEV